MAPALAAAPDQAPPVVVELFTSQSCSSCPPAEALLGELAGRPDLVALEFHVDYWNDLTYGSAGRWKDVHSDPAYTKRQRAYAAAIPGGVYTPQMVMDGRLQAVGSQPGAVGRAIAEARKTPHLALKVSSTDAGKWVVRAEGDSGASGHPAEIWLVRYLEQETTRVRGGENHGKVLVNHHIVTGMTRLGSWPFDGGALVFDADPRVLDEGCAVLIQTPRQGPILGAATCPEAP